MVSVYAPTRRHRSVPILCGKYFAPKLHYRPQQSWGKVMFSQVCVILFTAGCLPQCMLGYHTPPEQTCPLWSRHPPRSRHPPGADTHPPGADTPLEQTHIPQEQTPPPPGTEHAERYGQRAGDTHPTGMQILFSFWIYNQQNL